MSSPPKPPDGRQDPSGIAIPGIDAVAGVAYVGGDRGFYLKLIERFWRAHAASLAALAADAGAGRWQALSARTHALRGSAAAIGARGLRNAAGDVEDEIARAGMAGAGTVAALEAALAMVIDGLADYFSPPHDAGQGRASDLPHACAARAKLVIMLSEFSGDAIDFFDECKFSLQAILSEEALARLAAHMDCYEFDAARMLLEPQLPIIE